ncbi:GNAT family N-acetyltransferase [Haloplasma contractile]|uniref:UDP-N-acetylmuramoylalanine--D-glutamate ligase protein n=1 Tax=Haloplasma contractile SSD-17B TaxID=1033810 RepID=F7PTM9_9MOLU|nr:GNAT family protein [Haloplasma contractile]ERJ12195.1 UDP-N-acetylmuramoylalanine--D-glutamate ligase protein [Haloplasma contractile SSD-17B]
MNVKIELLSTKHIDELLTFEKENRLFFESSIPGRKESYYSKENLVHIVKEIEEEQDAGLCYMYLIRNKKGELVGRVNLFSIVRGIFEKAELGFRIAEKHNGKGYATQAVKLVLNEAFNNYNLHRVEAGTSPNNIGSQIVLIKNGFEFIGRAHDVIKVNGKWEDGVLFECLNKVKDYLEKQ